MRYFRRLPPVLRAASLLGLLFPLAALVVLLIELIAFLLPPSLSRPIPMDADRLFFIALNLGMLGGAFSAVVHSYTVRFRQPGGREQFPLETWQSQARALVLGAALPLGAILLVVVIPPTWITAPIAFVVSMLGAVRVGMAYDDGSDKEHALP